MKHHWAFRWGTVAAMVVIVFPAGAIAGLIDFQGYSWEQGAFPPSQAGDVLEVVGMVSGIESPLSWDPANRQYTFHVYRLRSSGEQVIGDNIIVSYTGGGLGIHEDTSFDAEYGVFPPNTVAPQSFKNGTLFASFEIQSMTLFYNTTLQSGAFEGVVLVSDGGSHRQELQPYADGMTFGGLFSFGSPDGYDMQWDGQILFGGSVPVRETTWAKVKNVFAE